MIEEFTVSLSLASLSRYPLWSIKETAFPMVRTIPSGDKDFLCNFPHTEDECPLTACGDSLQLTETMPTNHATTC